MTLVAYQTIVEIRDGRTRQLSYREIDSIVSEVTRIFGMIAYNPKTFQPYLDRYCQRKGIKPLIIIDISI
jgi:hypothetical protein